jgi:hypothetical protein
MTAVMKGLSQSAVAGNVTINQLLPERIDSCAACRPGISPA